VHNGCNRSMGATGDNPEKLLKLAAYLFEANRQVQERLSHAQHLALIHGVE
jgi:hypothetical protein